MFPFPIDSSMWHRSYTNGRVETTVSWSTFWRAQNRYVFDAHRHRTTHSWEKALFTPSDFRYRFLIEGDEGATEESVLNQLKMFKKDFDRNEINLVSWRERSQMIDKQTFVWLRLSASKERVGCHEMRSSRYRNISPWTMQWKSFGPRLSSESRKNVGLCTLPTNLNCSFRWCWSISTFVTFDLSIFPIFNDRPDQRGF